MPDDKTYRILILIATSELAGRAEELLSKNDITSQYMMKGQGTASSDVMNLLGLGTPDKGIVACMLPQDTASQCLRMFRSKLYLGMPNTGVAFTIPVSGASSSLLNYIDMNSLDKGEKDMSEDREFSMIVAIVDQGSSDDVMNAARPAGASGGTVLHSRRLNSDKAMKFWNISIQEERELVLILTRNSRKKEIMEAIIKNCGMESDAHGVVFSLPIADIEGMG